jgi:hypothetical protein
MEPTIEKKSNGALIGSIIIVLILIIGGIYVWMNEVKQPTIPEQQNTVENSEEQAAAIKAYDELTILEQEINNTNNADTSVDVETIQ